jgi:hypothetical protein
MLTKVIPVKTTWITEENLPFDKVSYIRYGRIGFKEHSDRQSLTVKSVTRSQLTAFKTEDIKEPLRDKISEGQNSV